MIRLNDSRKTVIDEKVINGYGSRQEFTFGPINEINKIVETLFVIIPNNEITVRYETKELRDKDNKLLDKLFDVKNIENYVYGREPDETQTIKNQNDEYITYDEVVERARKEPNSQLWVRLPNDKSVALKYNPVKDVIYFISPHEDMMSGEIYDKDLFNALKLRKVE